jgi:opacity protein-like surface antigen
MFTQNWSVKVEYLHYDLGTASFTWLAQDTAINIGTVYQNETTSVHNQGNVVRVGLNCLW